MLLPWFFPLGSMALVVGARCCLLYALLSPFRACLFSLSVFAFPGPFSPFPLRLIVVFKLCGTMNHGLGLLC